MPPMSSTDFAAFRQLRLEAEASLRQIPAGPTPFDSPEHLLHELRVHQIELEMQNDELRRAQIELAKMRDRYVDLYEFAPIAYITLTVRGEIISINQTGASLLAVTPAESGSVAFEQFVMAEDQARWRQFLGQARECEPRQDCELRMRRRDGTIFFGALCSSLLAGEDGQAELRIALTDVSGRKNEEQARRKLEARLGKLTRREKQVLVLALSGMINKDIAAHLRISQRAVENYRSRIHGKTGSASLLELSHQAASAGIVLDDIAVS